MKIRQNQFWKSKSHWHKQFGWNTDEGWTIKIGAVLKDKIYCKCIEWENTFVTNAEHIEENYEYVCQGEGKGTRREQELKNSGLKIS